MAFEALLAFTGATLCGGLAIFVLLANSRLFIHRVFASGMSALGMVQICAGMGAQAVLPADIVCWEYLRLLSAACLASGYFSACISPVPTPETLRCNGVGLSSCPLCYL